MIVHSYKIQLLLWLLGKSVHSDHRSYGKECCPDFSCCYPAMRDRFTKRLKITWKGING